MNRSLKSTASLLALFVALPAFALERTALAPPDARIDCRISNTTNFLDKLKKSSAGKLWADRQFRDFLGIPGEDLWEELLFDGEKTAENEMSMEQLKMLKGEVIFALGKGNDDPYIIAAMSKEDFERSLVLDDKMASSMEDPIKIVKSTFQDVEIVQHIQNAGTDDESSSWQAHLNNTLIMGPGKEWVEKSIVELKKEPVKEPDGNPVLNINVPLAALIRETLAKENDSNRQNPTAVNEEALLESLGLLGIEKLTVRIEMKDTEMIADNNLVATSLGKGIFTILDTQPSELPTVGFIPENITLLEVGRLNLLRFWQEIPTVLSAAMPAAKPQFDMALAMIRQQIGIDLEQDLLSNLGTKYVSFSTIENDRLASVLALDLKDSQAFKHGLEAIMAAPALQPQVAAALETTDFLGHPLYESKNTAPDETISFAVVGNYLLYGSPDGVRQVIRSVSSEAAANPAFERIGLVQGLRQLVPPTAFAYSAVDWKKNMSFIIRELNKPDRLRIIQEKWATSGAPIPPPDFAKLPPTEHIASFFNVTYHYIEKTDNGLHQRIIMKY